MTSRLRSRQAKMVCVTVIASAAKQSHEATCYHEQNYTWGDCFFLIFFLFAIAAPFDSAQGRQVRLPLALLVGGAKTLGL